MPDNKKGFESLTNILMRSTELPSARSASSRKVSDSSTSQPTNGFRAVTGAAPSQTAHESAEVDTADALRKLVHTLRESPENERQSFLRDNEPQLSRQFGQLLQDVSYISELLFPPSPSAGEPAAQPAVVNGQVAATRHRYEPRKTLDITVTKRSGQHESYDADKINRSIEKACEGLPDTVSKVTQIALETELTLYDGITTEELDEATVNAAVQNIKDDPDFDIIATRLLLKIIYKKILGHYDSEVQLQEIHQQGFIGYIKEAVADELLTPEMLERFDLDELAHTLDLSRDRLLKYIGLRVMMKRYMICGRDGHVLETPQYFRMRVAMGLSLAEADPTKWAKIFYEKLSQVEYVTGGSCSVGAGTLTSRLSNCYLLEMHDSMEHIGKTVSDVMQLSKATGGIGLSVTKLRAEGSPIRSNNTVSSGPVPFLHTIDSTLRAVSRAGKKMGALCIYMENWHLDFQDFLDLKQNAGDEYRRTRTANTAVYISDEFMKRVRDDEDWFLFDPADVPDLNELYGAKFSQRYQEYIEQAQAGQLKRFKKVRAKEQYRQIIVSLITTSHPWLTWKDTINVRALNNNTGTIHCSNLCTEVCLPQDKDNIAVCNLTYINLARHIDRASSQVDWTLLEDSVRKAMRLLDNLVEINKLPIAEATKADKENRAVGLGLMGFAESLELLNLAYDSEGAYELADEVFEFVSYAAIDESANLAQERGSYANFPGSMWSQGQLPIDTLDMLGTNRSLPLTVTNKVRRPLDWEILRGKVKSGMRNATVMAIAPNANGGLLAGTSPGLDPRFSQIFSRATNSGKYLEINENLMRALMERGLWEQTKDQIVSNHGDISEIEEIPDDLKAVYKTSFTTSPYAYIEVAARAQKWIDQAISRNIYLETRDVDEVMKIYMTAWEKGLKTTYYLHMKPRHSAEQSTVKVNKATATGKLGFGAVRNGATNGATAKSGFGAAQTVSNGAPASPSASLGGPEAAKDVVENKVKASPVIPPVAPAPIVNNTSNPSVSMKQSEQAVNTCPVDPQERLNCESCT